MIGIDYGEKIPNNVNLAEDRVLRRALLDGEPDLVRPVDIVGRRGH